MGVMDKMRRSTGVILWVLIFSFGILWMLQDTQVFNAMGAGPRSLGSVNGETISNEEYQSRVSYYTNQYSQQTGNSANAEQRASFEQRAWDELITSKLISQKMDQLGITVTDEEVVNMIKGENPDPFIRQQFGREDGTIDRAALNQAINSEQNSQVWVAIEQQLRQKRRQQKMTNYVQSAMRVSRDEVEQRYIQNNTTADFSYVRLPYADISDSEIEVTDSDLKTYYDNHPDQFQRKESYRFKYIGFDKTPTKEDTARTIKDLEGLRSDFSQTTDDSLFLSRYQSTTPYNAGFVNQDDVRELFQPALDTLEQGEVSNIIQDGGEVYIVKNVEEEGAEIKFQVLSFQVKADPIATIDQRAEEADDFKFFADQDGFEDEAERRNLTIQDGYATKGTSFIAGLGQSRQIMNMLDDASQGEVSDPIELPGQFVVIKVTEVTPEGVRSFEDVKSQIESTVRTQKKREAAVQRLNTIRENNNSMESIAEAAGKELQEVSALAMGDATIPGAGREPQVIGSIFGLQQENISQPIKGNGAAFVIQVTNKKEADPMNMNNAAAQQIRQQLQKQKSSMFSQVWLEQLKDEANIEDYRSQVLQSR